MKYDLVLEMISSTISWLAQARRTRKSLLLAFAVSLPLAAEAPRVSGKVYNVAFGRSVTLLDLLDEEAARLDAFYSSLSDDDWDRPSRCEGWTVRDLLGHLASGEEYHRACLDGTVSELISRYAERGATDLDSANAMGVADHADLTAKEVLERWRTADAENRRRFRQRGDGRIDTSIGDYPCRWQAFHVASELATHADDADVALLLQRHPEWSPAQVKAALTTTARPLTAGGSSVPPSGEWPAISPGAGGPWFHRSSSHVWPVSRSVTLTRSSGRPRSTTSAASAGHAPPSARPGHQRQQRVEHRSEVVPEQPGGVQQVRQPAQQVSQADHP